MFLVNDAEEMQRVAQLEITPPLDLALEFVDTRSSDGCFRKWRSHVIGNKVIPRQVQLAKTWKVNLDEAEPSEQAVEETANSFHKASRTPAWSRCRRRL